MINNISLESLQPSRLSTAGVLPRERLFARLDEVKEHHPIVWIGGPPGAGKTTLIASYLEKRQLAAIWCHLDCDDGEPETLFDKLRWGLNGASGWAAEGIPLPSAEDRTSPVNGHHLFRQIYSRLPNPGVLVLDDCHEVAHDAQLHALLVDGARDVPRGIHVILVGRGEPPSIYTRLVANGALAVFDWRGLHLTWEETRALAGDTCANESVLEELYRQCGGWAAGVAITLARLERNGADPQHSRAEIREGVFDYFAGEVFDRLGADERQILMSTALVPRVSVRVAHELSGSPQAQALLNKLADLQIFTSRTAATPATYEYTPLFREFLLSRVECTLGPEAFQLAANRASVILEQCGDLDACAALHERTKDWPSLQRMIFNHGTRLLAQGQARLVRRWLATVPAHITADSAWLTYWSGAAMIAESPVRARALLEKAWTRFEEGAGSSGRLLTAAAMLETYQFEWSSYEEAGRWIDLLEVCLSAGPRYPSVELELRVLANLLFALTRVRPVSKFFSICVTRLRSLLDAGIDVNHRLFAARALLVACCSSMDVASAQETARRARSMLQEEGCSPAARAPTLNAMAYSLCFEGALAEADSTVQEALSVTGRPQLSSTDPLHHMSRQLLASARRDRAAIAECVHDLRRSIDPTRHFGMSMLSRALAEHAMLRGEPAAAMSHWRAAVTHADEARASPMQWTSRLALSGYLAMRGDCAEAARVLEAARSLAEGQPEGWRRDCELLAAYVALRRDDRDEAQRILSSALVSLPYAPVASQAFALFPAQMAEFCMEALRCDLAVESVRGLIQHHRLPPPMGADCEWPWPFKVFVLGRFRVLKADIPIRFSRRTQRKPLELLQALIAFGGTEVGATVLTDALWPDSEGDAGYHALESALYRLRQLLGAPGAVTMAGGKLSLDRDQFWVDLWMLESELQMSTRHAQSAEHLARMRQLYAGHFLEHDSEKPWALKTRQALRERFVRAVRDVARSYESRRLWQEAANVYQAGIEVDSLAEDLHRGLIVCHHELGNHAEALQAFRRCRELLIRVLGVQPNAKTLAIYQSVRQNVARQAG
jgi:LuxR family transcriptional regulator, maltose regulon positive regulatory protein